MFGVGGHANGVHGDGRRLSKSCIGDDACEFETHNCAEGEDCTLMCSGGGACTDTTIHAADGHSLTVLCGGEGDNTCSGLQIHAEGALAVSFSCTAKGGNCGSLAKLFCPGCDYNEEDEEACVVSEASKVAAAAGALCSASCPSEGACGEDPLRIYAGPSDPHVDWDGDTEIEAFGGGGGGDDDPEPGSEGTEGSEGSEGSEGEGEGEGEGSSPGTPSVSGAPMACEDDSNCACEGTDACDLQTHTCAPGADCTLTCAGESACADATVRAPEGHALSVRCHGSSVSTCSGLKVHAELASSVTFECTATGGNCGNRAKVFCPGCDYDEEDVGEESCAASDGGGGGGGTCSATCAEHCGDESLLVYAGPTAPVVAWDGESLIEDFDGGAGGSDSSGYHHHASGSGEPLECEDGSNCDCAGDDACEYATHTCDPDEDCTLTCSGSGACTDTAIHAAEGHALTVLCSGEGDNTCSGIRVHAEGASSVSFSCTATGGNCGNAAKVFCPGCRYDGGDHEEGCESPSDDGGACSVACPSGCGEEVLRIFAGPTAPDVEWAGGEVDIEERDEGSGSDSGTATSAGAHSAAHSTAPMACAEDARCDCVGDDACEYATHTCDPDEDCTLTCSGNGACTDSSVHAPVGHALTVRCEGEGKDNTCSGLKIHAETASSVSLTCTATGGNCGNMAKVFCPGCRYEGGEHEEGCADSEPGTAGACTVACPSGCGEEVLRLFAGPTAPVAADWAGGEVDVEPFEGEGSGSGHHHHASSSGAPLECEDDSNCDCVGDDACEYQTHTCDPAADCTLTCSGSGACTETTIHAAAGHALTVLCSGEGDNTCSGIRVHAESASSVSLECTATGGNCGNMAKLFCPGCDYDEEDEEHCAFGSEEGATCGATCAGHCGDEKLRIYAGQTSPDVTWAGETDVEPFQGYDPASSDDPSDHPSGTDDGGGEHSSSAAAAMVCEDASLCACVGDDACEFQAHTCAVGEDCDITCDGGGACTSLTVHAPAGHALAIRCEGDGGATCSGLTVHAESASAVSLACAATGGAVCDMAQVFCPGCDFAEEHEDSCEAASAGSAGACAVTCTAEGGCDGALGIYAGPAPVSVVGWDGDTAVEAYAGGTPPPGTGGAASASASASDAPTKAPTKAPTAVPSTKYPTKWPTKYPSSYPTEAPSTKQPTRAPTQRPSLAPTKKPSPAPTKNPSPAPTKNPTPVPTHRPSEHPTARPTHRPSAKPTEQHCRNGVLDINRGETFIDCGGPECSPCGTGLPCEIDSDCLSAACDQSNPAGPSCLAPTQAPSHSPTARPSARPSARPTPVPSEVPTASPTPAPTPVPSTAPTPVPSTAPTASPTASPSRAPLVIKATVTLSGAALDGADLTEASLRAAIARVLRVPATAVTIKRRFRYDGRRRLARRLTRGDRKRGDRRRLASLDVSFTADMSQATNGDGTRAATTLGEAVAAAARAFADTAAVARAVADETGVDNLSARLEGPVFLADPPEHSNAPTAATSATSASPTSASPSRRPSAAPSPQTGASQDDRPAPAPAPTDAPAASSSGSGAIGAIIGGVVAAALGAFCFWKREAMKGMFAGGGGGQTVEGSGGSGGGAAASGGGGTRTARGGSTEGIEMTVVENPMHANGGRHAQQQQRSGPFAAPQVESVGRPAGGGGSGGAAERSSRSKDDAQKSKKAGRAGGQAAEEEEDPAAAAPAPPPGDGGVDDWESHRDPESGRVYFFSPSRGVSTFELPPSWAAYDAAEQSNQAEVASALAML